MGLNAERDAPGITKKHATRHVGPETIHAIWRATSVALTVATSPHIREAKLRYDRRAMAVLERHVTTDRDTMNRKIAADCLRHLQQALGKPST